MSGITLAVVATSLYSSDELSDISGLSLLDRVVVTDNLTSAPVATACTVATSYDVIHSLLL
jgi:hypothetical protein